MGFEKFGRHGYISQTKIAPVVDRLQKGELPATRCSRCHTLYFPPRSDCPKCRNTSTTWTTIDPGCTLVSFTKVYFAPPEFQDQAPYMLGLAELKSGQRVFAPIDQNVDIKLLRPGLEFVLRPKVEGDRAFYKLERRTEKPYGSGPDS